MRQKKISKNNAKNKPWKNKKFSDEHRRKMSEAKKNYWKNKKLLF